MAKEYVPIYFDWLDVTQDLTAEEKGNLIDAVMSYANGLEYEHLLTGSCRIAFRFLKGQVDRNAAISDVRRQARQGKEQTVTSDNKTEQNGTNDNKTKQTGTNSDKKTIEKEKEKEKEKQKEKEEKEERFARFWVAYPRRVNKQTAYKAFQKLNPDEGLLTTMLQAIERQKNSAQWRENGGQYIPHPSTWLNGRRWEDELKAETNGSYNQRDYSGEQEAAMKRMMEDGWV